MNFKNPPPVDKILKKSIYSHEIICYNTEKDIVKAGKK